MECPHCNYKSGWDAENLKNAKGELGEFYSLPIKLSRDAFHEFDDHQVYGCPNCMIVFHD